jgi:hypothetical protein
MFRFDLYVESFGLGFLYFIIINNTSLRSGTFLIGHVFLVDILVYTFHTFWIYRENDRSQSVSIYLCIFEIFEKYNKRKKF